MDAIALGKVRAGHRRAPRSPALITIPMARVLHYTDIRRGVLLIANYSTPDPI